jgi:hypothetical protein
MTRSIVTPPPPNSAAGLQEGSGPSADFLAKILSVDTPLFLYHTRIYFIFSSLLLNFVKAGPLTPSDVI